MSLLATLAVRGAADGAGRDIDVLTLGRVGLDLYAREHDADFADVTGFDKHVGGSPGLIAIGAARLGKRTAILTRVSDDMVGRYVAKRLASGGVSTDGVVLDDSGTRTTLALTEMRADGCQVVIYRNGAADLALCEADIDPALVRRARVLLISGTALSREPSRSAARRAMSIADGAGIPVALDLDYRAYTWASRGEAGGVTREAAARASILIGNREEFEVLGVPAGATAAEVAETCFNGTTSLVLVKAGADGSDAFLSDGTAHRQPIFPVDAAKPFGAGDAYAASVLSCLLDGQGIEQALCQGAAAAAIVVAGTSCDDAMPTLDELTRFLNTHQAA